MVGTAWHRDGMKYVAHSEHGLKSVMTSFESRY